MPIAGMWKPLAPMRVRFNMLPFPTMVQTIWKYRGFVLGSVKREFQIKYRNSLLGAAWTILNPLAMILVYTVIFSQVMRTKLPGVDSSFAYSIYLCSGVLTWGLFAEITGRAQTVFLENANLIKKINFPRLCLPVVVVLNALINFSIIFGLFSLFLILSGNFPGWSFFAIIPILLVQIIFSIGLGITLGVLNVFFRDIGHFFGIFLQFWFWFTPVVYPVSILPEKIKLLLVLNPVAAPIMAYQRVLVYGQWPEWESLAPFSLMALLLCIIGMRLFRTHAGEMVDEL
jgi:lipopolysaccharide transport system permease protein